MFSQYPYINYNDLNLDWIIKLVKSLHEEVLTMDAWREKHEKEYLELKKLYDDIISGRFPESIIQAFEDWMKRNALDLIGELSKMVIFGLTDSGYFVAYIPESWSDIIFNTTGYDIFIPAFTEYGHLTLSY